MGYHVDSSLRDTDTLGHLPEQLEQGSHLKLLLVVSKFMPLTHDEF
jgi:hypothetical protein